MKFCSVFDPCFRAFGRLVPGLDTAALEQALGAHPQPEQGVVYEAKPGAPDLCRAAEALAEQLFPGVPASWGIYSGKLAHPRRLLGARRGIWLLGAFDFLLPLSTRAAVRRRRLQEEHLTAFYVPAGVLVELYATTLHCVPCHTHDRDGLSVLMLRPVGPLHRTAVRGRQALAQKFPSRQPSQPKVRRPLQVRLTPKPPAEEAPEEEGRRFSRERLGRALRAAAPRRLYGSARWRVHVAARLKAPPTEL